MPAESSPPNALYSAKAASLPYNTDITESQWVRSVMGHQQQAASNTAPFNYSAAGTNLPSTQISYGQFMEQVMSSSAPTRSFPSWSESSLSSVQPSGQGVSHHYGFWGNAKYGIESVGDALTAGFGVAPGEGVRGWRQSNRDWSSGITHWADGAASGISSSAMYQDLNAISDGLVIGSGRRLKSVYNELTNLPKLYSDIDDLGNNLEAGLGYLGEHPFKSAYAMYQMGSAYLDHLSSQTTVQNLRELSEDSVSFLAGGFVSKLGLVGKLGRGVVSFAEAATSSKLSVLRAGLFRETAPLVLDAENVARPGSLGSMRAWTVKARIKKEELPNEGRVRFIPPKNYYPSMPLRKGPGGGFLDKFDNEWRSGASRTAGQSFEWDVQLSPLGRKHFGWATRDGSHLNVSLDGHITHR